MSALRAILNWRNRSRTPIRIVRRSRPFIIFWFHETFPYLAVASKTTLTSSSLLGFITAWWGSHQVRPAGQLAASTLVSVRGWQRVITPEWLPGNACHSELNPLKAMARLWGIHGSSSRRSSPASYRSPRKNNVVSSNIARAHLSSTPIGFSSVVDTPRDSSSKNRCTNSSSFGSSAMLKHWRESCRPNGPTTHHSNGVRFARDERG